VRWFPYDPAARVDALIEPASERATFEISAGGRRRPALHARRRCHFVLAGRRANLALYWLEGYARRPVAAVCRCDHRRGRLTAAGRYLYDTIKGADLGVNETSIVLDFNYAYHPSCAYDQRWSCPLAPPENRLDFAVEAGERLA
jgi:uncharacterized protein (DUF1684 family)